MKLDLDSLDRLGLPDLAAEGEQVEFVLPQDFLSAGKPVLWSFEAWYSPQRIAGMRFSFTNGIS
jgi:hypothetical protein